MEYTACGAFHDKGGPTRHDQDMRVYLHFNLQKTLIESRGPYLMLLSAYPNRVDWEVSKTLDGLLYM